MLLRLVMFQSPVLFHKDGMGYPVYCLVRLILDHITRNIPVDLASTERPSSASAVLADFPPLVRFLLCV